MAPVTLVVPWILSLLHNSHATVPDGDTIEMAFASLHSQATLFHFKVLTKQLHSVSDFLLRALMVASQVIQRLLT